MYWVAKPRVAANPRAPDRPRAPISAAPQIISPHQKIVAAPRIGFRSQALPESAIQSPANHLRVTRSERHEADRQRFDRYT